MNWNQLVKKGIPGTDGIPGDDGYPGQDGEPGNCDCSTDNRVILIMWYSMDV